MSCKDKDGGTHHYACDCREAYLRRLENENKALREIGEKMANPLREIVGQKKLYFDLPDIDVECAAALEAWENGSKRK